MIIDLVLLMFAIAFAMGGIAAIVSLRPAAQRKAIRNRKAERDAEIERLTEELHLDQ